MSAKRPAFLISANVLDWVALIDRLEASDRDSLRAHFLALNEEDRRLRFGSVSDGNIAAYVDGIDFVSSYVYGVRGPGLNWLAIGHLSEGKGVAELGLSVLPQARGKGLGGAIFRYAVAQASRRGATRLYMHCLTSNRAILSIARSAGMSIGSSGGETDAYLVVPDRAEMIEALVGESATS